MQNKVVYFLKLFLSEVSNVQKERLIGVLVLS